ncbi:MAG: DEAD/DEAH box helicase [Methylomonas sp.]|jgi:hypothetical protein|uniref:helicase-related protein n=1 Tax=Methylomonas sp. TaxID=418 RepID=UPI0025EBB98C|nr:helicase-related protein [Methylomonas sp.]MCK9607558.1 DEAD/DEAH box helicase [Methylomonas sp.]
MEDGGDEIGETRELDRNSTNFAVELFEYLKSAKWDSGLDFLLYHQNIVRIYMRNVSSTARGLLIYHGTGMGKSLLAMSIAIDQIEERPVIVLLTKSLITNMRAAIHQYHQMRSEFDPNWKKLSIPEIEEWIDKHFSFVSMNASNMYAQMETAQRRSAEHLTRQSLETRIGLLLDELRLDGRMLIVDEAHNFFRAVSNGAANASKLYDLVMRSHDLKIVFLSGTPIVHDPFELAVCFNMLGSRNFTLFTEYYQDFRREFVSEDGTSIIKKNYFQNRIFGLVSFVDRKSTPGIRAERAPVSGETKYAVLKGVSFPQEYDLQTIKCKMEEEQFGVYLLARDKEKSESAERFGVFNREDLGPLQKPRGPRSTYRVQSRQLSNYCPPKGLTQIKEPTAIPGIIKSVKFERMLEVILASHDKQLGLIYSQFTGIGGLGIFARFLEQHGYSAFVLPEKTSRGVGILRPIKSAEQQALQESLEKIDGSGDESVPILDDKPPTSITSQLMAEKMYANAIPQQSQPPETPPQKQLPLDVGGGKRFALIIGDIPTDDREIIRNIFNSKENAHGEIIALLLVSSTGAEGLDLMHVRHIHILEPYWNYGRIQQVRARGIRNNSHADLPPEEQNVSTYLYVAVGPPGFKGTTTDEEILAMTMQGKKLINSFEEALKEVSIECALNGGQNCRICVPNKHNLFTAELMRDLRALDPCVPAETHTVSARKVQYGGNTYFYIPSAQSIYGVKIYQHDPRINAYMEVDQSLPDYSAIAGAITAQEQAARAAVKAKTAEAKTAEAKTAETKQHVESAKQEPKQEIAKNKEDKVVGKYETASDDEDLAII